MGDRMVARNAGISHAPVFDASRCTRWSPGLSGKPWVRASTLWLFARAFRYHGPGATVVIDGNAADHVRTTDTSLLAPFDGKGRRVERAFLRGQQFRWTPDRSPP